MGGIKSGFKCGAEISMTTANMARVGDRSQQVGSTNATGSPAGQRAQPSCPADHRAQPNFSLTHLPLGPLVRVVPPEGALWAPHRAARHHDLALLAHQGH